MTEAFDLVPLDFTPQPQGGGSMSGQKVIKGNENYDLVELDFTPQDAAPTYRSPFSSVLAMQQPSQPAAPQPQQDDHWALTRGAVSGFMQQNPEMLAESLEAMSVLTGSTDLEDASKYVKGLSENAPKGYEPQTHSMSDIDGISKALTYAGERLGEGLSSTVPSLVTGTAGAVGGGAVAGPGGAVLMSLLGAASPSYALNQGELYKALKDEGVDKTRAAKWASEGAVPITGLDIIPIAGWTGRLTGSARKEAVRGFAKRMIQEFGKGAASEAGTEAAQQALQEGIVSEASGKDFWTPETLQAVAEAGLAGGLTGGVIGAATGVMPDKGEQAESPGQDTPAPGQNAPTGPEMAPRTGAADEPSPWGKAREEAQASKTAEQAAADGELTPVDYELQPFEPGNVAVSPEIQDAQQTGVAQQRPFVAPISAEYTEPAPVVADEQQDAQARAEEAKAAEPEQVDPIPNEAERITEEERNDAVDDLMDGREQAATLAARGMKEGSPVSRREGIKGSETYGLPSASGTVKVDKDGYAYVEFTDPEDGQIKQDYAIRKWKSGTVSNQSTASEPGEKINKPPVGTPVKVFLGNESEPYFESARIAGYDDAEGRVRLETPQGEKKWLVNEIRLEPIEEADNSNTELSVIPEGDDLRKTLEAVRDKTYPIQDQATRATLIDQGYVKELTSGSLSILPAGRRKIVELSKPAQKPVTPALKNVAKTSIDDDLLTFLRKSGGIRDDDGELRARDLHKPTKGVGLIVRKNGRSLDAAREIAEEAGYIPKGSSVQDLLDAIDQQVAGKKVRSGEGLTAAINDEMQAEADAGRDQYESQFESEGERQSIEDQAARIREIDHDAAQEYLEAEKLVSEHLEPHEIHKIKGEPVTLQDLENINVAIAEAEAVQGKRRGVGEQSEAAGKRSSEGGERSSQTRPSNRGTQEHLTEATPEGEQSLIPGVKPVTDRDKLKLQSDAPLKGSGNQKPADEGIFDTGARAQMDLVEQAKKPAQKPVQESSEPKKIGIDPATGSQEIEDVGEKIGGARKDTWRSRGLSLSDLDGMTGGEEAQYVTKDNIWPKPDYAALIDGGLEPEAAALYKIVRDRLAGKPSFDTPESRRYYVEMLGFVRDEFGNARSQADIKKVNQAVQDKVDWANKWRDDETRKKLFSLYRGNVNPLNVKHADIRRARKLLEDGWPNTKKTRERSDTSGETPKRPYLDEINRSGKDVRDGRNIGGEDLIEDFGFRGVEYGNWVNQEERQASLNAAYEGLHDLADILGVPAKALSLDGSLGLAFGARGGGKAAAHYEPGKLVINLTKTSGAGTLAHEWGHALDHYFGELDTDSSYDGAPKGASGWYDRGDYSGKARRNLVKREGKWERRDAHRLENLRPEMRDAWDVVMRALFERSKTKAEAVRKQELTIEQQESSIAQQREMMKISEENAKDGSDAQKKSSAKFIKESNAWIARQERVLDISKRRLAELRDQPEPENGYGSVSSSYVEQAQKLVGKSTKGYWTRPTEMLARAFEAYVFDKIGDRGDVSQYLVQGVEQDRYQSPTYKGNPYPTGLEREAINSAFDKLFDTMDIREGKNGPALYSRFADQADKPIDEDMLLSGEGADKWPGLHKLLADAGAFDASYRSEITGPEQQKIADRIKRIAKQIAPGVDVKVFGEIISKEGTDVSGLYRPAHNLIEVALNYGDPEVSVRHETIHALKEADLFTEQEWSMLEEKARRDWAKKYDIEQIYPELSKTGQLEEAIAQGFGEFRRGEKMLPRFRRIFSKLRDFFTRVGNALRGMGYQTVGDIFERVERGDVGRRKPTTKTDKQQPGSSAGFFNERVTAEQEKDENVKYSLAWLTKKTAGSVPKQTGSADVNELIDDIMTDTRKPMPTAIREGLNGYFTDRAVKFKQAFLDRFASIGELEKDVSGEIRDASKSAYKAARVTTQLRSFVSYVLKHGPLEFYYEPKTAGQWVRPKQNWQHGGLEDILRPLAKGGSLKLWKGWMIAQRARRLDQEGRENLFAKVAEQRGTTVDAVIDTIEREARAHPQFNEFQTAKRKWQALNRAMLDFAERGGLINADQRATWEHSDYIPFYRVMEDMEVKGSGRGRSGIANQRSGIRRLKGGEAQINDVVENMVLNITSLVDRSLKNIAMQRTIELARAAGIAKPARNQFGRAFIPSFWRQKDVQNAMAAVGWDMSMVPTDMRDDVVQLMQMTAPQGPNIASVMIKGKAKYFEVDDPLLMEAIQAFNPNQINGVLGVFRAAKKLLTRGVTLDPAFMVANAMRDTLHSWVVAGDDGFTPIIDSAKGFKSALTEDKTFRQMMASGAGGGGFYAFEPDDVSKLLNREFHGGEKGLANTAKETARRLFEAYERIGQASEYANRVAVYEGIRKSGGTDAEAAFRALDLLDYSMHGSSAGMQIAIQTLPFLNARIQGLARMVRGAKEHPQSFLLRGMLIAAISTALFAMNEDDDRYESMPDWQKDMYWYLPIGNGILIPKPFEVGLLFGTLPERLARLVSGRDDMEDAWKAAKRALITTFEVNPIPQLARPMVEQWANRDWFTERPIVPRGLENLPDEMQYNAYTSETAKTIGHLTGQSPARIDHLVRGYFGSLGTYALAGTDFLMRSAGDYPDRPAAKMTDFPVLKRFVMDETQRSSKYVEKFYELRQEVTEIMNGARAMQRWGDTDEAKMYLASNMDKVTGYKALNKAAKLMSSIALRMRQVTSDQNMSAEDKRDELDMLTRKRNEIARIYSEYPTTIQIFKNVSEDPDAAAKLRMIAE